MEFNGSWAQFVVVPAYTCIKLPAQVDFVKGCNCIVNPLTCLCMLDNVINSKMSNGKKHTTIISTAAASQLGRMMIRVFRENNIRVINIVRRYEQVEILKTQENAEYVINSSDEDFLDQLEELSSKLQPSVGFDAIGGEMTGHVFNSLAKGGVLYTYGILSHQPYQFDSTKMIFSGVRIEGLMLGT